MSFLSSVGEPNSFRFICRYQIEKFVIYKDDEIMELDHSNVIFIEYMNDYEFNHMALLKVVLRIDIRKKIWILRHKRDIRVKFSMNRIGRDIENENYITNPEMCWNVEFGAYFNDEEESSDYSLLEHRLAKNNPDTNINDIDDENYFESQNLLDLYLINPDLIKSSRKIYNKVWTKTTLQNGVAQMLTETKHKKVLMSKFENDEVYKELLVPANPTYKNLIYLDQYYGFYRKGAIIYYDLDTLYIINANGELTASRQGEWTETTFVVPYLEMNTPGGGMIFREGEQIFYPTTSEMDLNPQKFSIGNNVETGSITKLIAKDSTTIDVYEADQSYIDQRNENLVFVNKEQKYAGDIIKARMEENECIFYITGEGFDVKAFSINKVFQIIFDDPIKHEKFGKNRYRLAYAYHAFKNDGFESLISTHRIVLKKTSTTLTDRDIRNTPTSNPPFRYL